MLKLLCYINQLFRTAVYLTFPIVYVIKLISSVYVQLEAKVALKVVF